MRKFAAENFCGKLLRKTFAENFCGKLLRKNIAENFCGKLLRITKSMRLTIYDRTKADVEISASGKISAPAKLPRLWNFRTYQNSCGKVLRTLTIWARQNLQLLISSKSGWRALIQILVDSVICCTCRPQVIWRLRPLCFYWRRLSRTVPVCCTGTTSQNFCRCQILCARRGFHLFLWKIQNSISASKCPHCTENLLSKFSYHTHRLVNGGRPRFWARLPESGYNPVGGVWGGEGSDKHSSPSAGHAAPSSPRLHSCWPCSVYQSGVSFPSFHLSLYREGCTVVDKNAHTMGARHYTETREN